jgi:Cu(I)/Ag(I) efflux system membrane fusion protein
MYVNALLKIELGSSVVLPVSAVIDSGKRQMVWVEREPGIFEPRQVQVGQRSVDKLQILSGVTAGEKVAVSGAYLIDSESQLRGNSQDHSQHTGTAGQPAPATGKKPDPLDMGDMQMK